MSMPSWLKDFSRKRPGQVRNMFTPRNTTSVIFSKGLLNAPGDNNCFLNSAVQVLWHLDVFRRSFREMTGHACMGKACIFCALKALFNKLQHSEEMVLPPDALRKALASAFQDQDRFQLGLMDDAAECFENILVRIHFHLAHNIKEELCDAKHCIPHRKFAMTLIEHNVCRCGATSEPFPFTQMVHYVSSAALCAEAHSMRDSRRWPNTDHFGDLLRKAGAIGDLRDCPSSCGRQIKIRRILMNCPDVLSIGLIWDSDKPDVEHISDVICNLGTTILLRELFDDAVDDRAKANSLFLVGIVTYYGRHYTTFFYNTSLRYWVYFDDAVVKQVGPNWSDVVDRCRRGHFQPLLLLYSYPDGKKVSNATAPKRVTMLKGYDKEDKENEVPGRVLKKPQECLSTKVDTLINPDEPCTINHHHGNSTSSNASGQSVSSGDSQNTLVYRAVGGVPEFQATSEPGKPSKGGPREDSAKLNQDWQIDEDGAVASASRASWIPNSVVEIGQDALAYVPMGKTKPGNFSISQFALDGHDANEKLESGRYTTSLGRSDHIVGQGHRVSSGISNDRLQESRGLTAPLPSGRPSSSRNPTADRSPKVSMSPQAVKRPSSAQSSTVLNSRNIVAEEGAVYNAKTGVVTGCDVHPSDPGQPSLTFEPWGNFSTEIENNPDNVRTKQLDIKPLQEFNVRENRSNPLPKSSERESTAQPISKASIVRQGSWSGSVRGPINGDTFVQRTNSLTMKPLTRHQDSHSSVPDLKDASYTGCGLNSLNSSFISDQGPRFSSVPDLQHQMGSHDMLQGRKHLNSDPIQMSPSMKRSNSLQSDKQIAPGGILAAAIRNQESSAAEKQQPQQNHIPLVRSSSVADRKVDEKQSRAKYNIQNGFLTLPGKKQVNHFIASSKQNFGTADGGRPRDSSTVGIHTGYTSPAMQQPTGVPQLHRQHSNEGKPSAVLHQDGITIRQTQEVAVTHGLDIDSIGSRDSGYRSRDRSSASSGSVYSLDAPLSDHTPSSVAPSTSSATSFNSSSAYPSHGHVHQTAAPSHHMPTAKTSPADAHSQPTSGSRVPRTSTQTSEAVVIEMVKGVDEQLLTSLKAEEEQDLAMALSLCTAAASTLKIALRLEGLKDQTRLFLQTKYNTTVLKSRSLHRRLTIERRAQEPTVSKIRAPPPPSQDPTRTLRDGKGDMCGRDDESLQELELLKQRVADLQSDKGAERHPKHSLGHSQASHGTTEVDTSRSAYQPQQYRSVPSSPTPHRSTIASGQTVRQGAVSHVNISVPGGAPQSYSAYNGRVTTSQPVHQGIAPAVSTSTSQTVPQGHSPFQKSSAATPVQRDWVQSQIGATTSGRSMTPHSFSSAPHPSDAGHGRYQGGYRSQTPTAYLGSTKPSDRSFQRFSQNTTAGNRNNNATSYQTMPVSRVAPQTDGQYASGQAQRGTYNLDWVERREIPRHDESTLGRPMMFDTTTCIKSNSALPQQGGVRRPERGHALPVKNLGDNLIDLG
ncbi:uncharacterized protein [Diadema antillarum]|uniref:uncharacterized protein n=1 Tax=Diadema antillarum TaxID=105358 RepID=UPI003A8AF416